MGYLIGHESRHHGSIVLAFKQSDLRLSEPAALGLWRQWIFGK